MTRCIRGLPGAHSGHCQPHKKLHSLYQTAWDQNAILHAFDSLIEAGDALANGAGNEAWLDVIVLQVSKL
jgi:hypothetical protein